MRTVVIATQRHIDWIYRYRLFLDAFLDSEVRLCPWNREGRTVDEMVPSIYDCIGGNRDWRAIVIFDDENTRGKINPFDVVELEKDESSELLKVLDENVFEDYDKGLDIKTERLKKAYDEASQMPLTRLCTFLCSIPLDANEVTVQAFEAEEKNEEMLDDMENMNRPHKVLLREMREASAINHYKDASNHKRRLRDQILDNDRLHANLPKDVMCISTRTILDRTKTDADSITLAWKNHNDITYSSFGDRNMYFERMRFLIYDILPDNHVNYKFNYLEFICTLLVMSANVMPNDAMVPNRLYAIESDFSENNLRNLLVKYDRKLENTVRVIEGRTREIEEMIPGPLTDKEAEELFQSNHRIEVLLDPHFEMEGFYADDSVFGLSRDCPEEERVVWDAMFRKSDKVMHKLIKQPRRSLEKATEELRRVNKADSQRALGLNRFQLEDIQEFVDNEEERMVSIKTNDFYDIDRYEEAQDKEDQNVKDTIETRMSKKTTVLLGIVAMVLFFVGFIPVIFFNKSVTSVPIPALLGTSAVALLGIAGFIYLFTLRGDLKNAVGGYNQVMKNIKKDVDDSMEQFSKLLSSACHVMKGNFILNECRKNDNSFKEHIRILRSHIREIRDRQAEMRELFGEYVADKTIPGGGETFDYNFDIVCEYPYPIPIDECTERKIMFAEEGNKATVPFDFIDSIKLRMEEIYE